MANVQPFHVSIKGLENAILCRDDDDYDAMVKYIAICALRKNVIIIIYAVVSNHCHEAVLARSQSEADAFGEELKRVYSMWFSRKYREENILQKVDSKSIALENDWHVRNALAYIPNNSLDNLCPVHEYRWSAYRAMFRHHQEMWKPGIKPVALLSKREKESILHTGERVNDVRWKLDEDNMLAPESFCDVEYLEQAFNNDQAFWLKTIGTLNPAEMEEKLVNAPRTMLPDSELFKEVADVCQRWFSVDIDQLPVEKKLRLLPYIWRRRKTTVNQLARVLSLERQVVEKAVKA